MPHSLDNSCCQRFPSKIWFLCFQAKEMFRSLQELPSLYSIWIGMYISWQMYNILKKNGNESTRLTKTSVWCCRSPSVKYSCKTKTWGLQRETMSGHDKVGEGTVQGRHQSHTGSSRVFIKATVQGPHERTGATCHGQSRKLWLGKSINTHRGSS